MEVGIQRYKNTAFTDRPLHNDGICGCGKTDLTCVNCINTGAS